MPTEHRFSRIVNHVEPVIATDGIVLADTLVEADAAAADGIGLVLSVLQHVELRGDCERER
jgi:hypothetical protein